MVRTAEIPAEERRAEILRLAERQLLSGGYKKLSMEALAAGCRISPAHLYNFFPAKIDITFALLDHECGLLIKEGEKRARAGKPVARLKRLLAAELDLTFAFLEGHPAYLDVMERVGRQRPKQANKLLAKGRKPLAEILAAGCADGSLAMDDAAIMAETIQIAMLKFRFPQLISSLPLAALREEAERVITCLLKGIERR